MSVGMGRGTVHVLGNIWQPGIGICAQNQTIRGEELDRLKFQGRIDRDDALAWANIAFGDFREITDIAITHHDIGNQGSDLDREYPDSEVTYGECMFATHGDDD